MPTNVGIFFIDFFSFLCYILIKHYSVSGQYYFGKYDLWKVERGIFMAKRKDLKGQVFGKLTVLSYHHTDKNGQACWLCRCECGNEVIVRGAHLRFNKIQSCGCMNRSIVSNLRHKSLVGNVFGRLTVLEEIGKTSLGEYRYRCKCSCGNEVIVGASNLTSRNTKSCGCLHKEIVSNNLGKKNKGKFKDISGKRFGKLVAVRIVTVETHGSKGDIPVWECKCDCGNTINVRRDYLVGGSVQSCGCLRHEPSKNLIDLTGQRFGSLIAQSYFRKNNKTYWNCVCDCGNETIVPAYKLKNHIIVSCGNHRINQIGSFAENEIKDYIESMGHKTEKAKKILDGKEIDILVVDKNIGIEYNGSVYHSCMGGVYGNKSKLYHQEKFLCAKEKGIHLISIFDVDWQNNQEKIKMYLRSLFLPQKELMARKLEVHKVNNNIACDFVDKYHIQGANKAMMKINYGLYYNDELYAVMSFGKLRLSKTEEGQYELHRYCVKDGYKIVGGANKLLKHFEIDYSPKYLLSYSDNDYFLGSIYPRLGFTYSGQSRPRYYWYLNGEERKRESCMLKRLKVECPDLLEEAYKNEAPNKEDYVMLSRGACKVYRSGNTKWEKFYNT